MRGADEKVNTDWPVASITIGGEKVRFKVEVYMLPVLESTKKGMDS